MSFTHNMRKVSLFLCCAIGIATTSGPSAFAVTARDALCAAELVTAGCRVTTLVANKLDAAGNTNARTANAIAYAVQATNELLALINSWEDVPRAIGYSGSWLVYDLYRFMQQIGGGSNVATDGKDGVINGATGVDDSVVESAAAPWLPDEFFDSLQRDLLPAIETVIAVAAAYVGWQGTAEQRVWRNRLQSLLSLSRIIRVCLERRHESAMKYYAAVATAHALLTIAEFTPLLRAEAKQPVIVVPDVQGGGPAVQQLVQAAQRRQQRAQALIDAAERQLREQPGNASARFNLREAQDLFEANQSELTVFQTLSPTTVGRFAEDVVCRTSNGAMLERRLAREEVESVERMRPPVVEGRLNQVATAHSVTPVASAPTHVQGVDAQTQDYFRDRNAHIDRMMAEATHEDASNDAVATLMQRELTGNTHLDLPMANTALALSDGSASVASGSTASTTKREERVLRYPHGGRVVDLDSLSRNLFAESFNERVRSNPRSAYMLTRVCAAYGVPAVWEGPVPPVEECYINDRQRPLPPTEVEDRRDAICREICGTDFATHFNAHQDDALTIHNLCARVNHILHA